MNIGSNKKILLIVALVLYLLYKMMGGYAFLEVSQGQHTFRPHATTSRDFFLLFLFRIFFFGYFLPTHFQRELCERSEFLVT